MLERIRASRASLGLLLAAPLLYVASAFGQNTPPVTSVAPADAAANANPAAGTATTERVIVTGSYIPTAETESALPVTVYTAEVLQKQGAQTPVEGLRQLPSFVGASSTENDSNGGNGSAGINLRAIGQQNVLILMNGRRAILGLGLNVSADINAIPISATSRTEVLKDGASAVYGSDAVAGVVNFIMLDGPGEAPYEGAEIFALYGNTTESDSHVRQVYVRGGVKTDKVSIAAAGEYYSRANLFSADRAKLSGSGDLRSTGIAGQMGLNPVGIGPLGRGGVNGNSPTFAGKLSLSTPVTLPDGRILSGNVVLLDLANNQVTPASYRRFEVTNVQLPPRGTQPGDTAPGTDPARFNFRAFTPAIPAMEKAMYYVTGRYKIFGDGLQVYGDILYAKTKQDNGAAASPFTLPNGAGRAEARASLFNPFGNALNSTAYRLIHELGPRRSFYDHDYYRYTVGLNGDFNFKGNGFISHFGYDTGLVYERFDQTRTDSGDATRTALLAEITANVFDPFIGQYAPSVGTAPEYVNGLATGRMIPYNNLVAGALNTTTLTVPAVATAGGAPEDTAVNGASYVGHSVFKERSWLLDAKINAHLFPNLYNGGIDFALGYEHRQDSQTSIPDPVQAAGDQLGFNQAPLFKFEQWVDSVFTEMTFPIVTSTMNVPFVRSLELAVAWRYEKFNNKDQTTHDTRSFENRNPDEDFGGSPRVSVRYQPIADLTLRANWNQSFRSPTPAFLFTPVFQNFPLLFDPLNSSTLQPPGGVNGGGSPDIGPETTDSYSAGFVYTPKWLPGFTMTADYYQLYTTHVLLTVANKATIVLFANGISGLLNNGVPTAFTANVTRDGAGNLISINGITADNAGTRNVQGLDVTSVYELPTQSFGTFTFSGGWNHFITYKVQGAPDISAGFTNFLGNYNLSTLPLAPGAVPFNKAFVRFEWQGPAGWMKGLDFVATGNYIGDYEDDPGFILGNTIDAANSTVTNPSYRLHHRISDYETLDLQLTYEFLKPEMTAAATGYSKDSKDGGKNAVAGVENNGNIWQRMLWGTKLSVGVNNVFDRYPPTALGAFNDNYDTSTYSIRNRYYYISLNKKF
ncbi:MAG: TonB-dependent receptor domain-containing protein [Rhizomicrobium sp.]